MASVFTYDPEPPRISSPWATPTISTPQLRPSDSGKGNGRPEGRLFGGLSTPPPMHLAECGISKLQAEPQEGPTEYKLHLLLRPRRTLVNSTTGVFLSGSHQSHSKTPPRLSVAASERFERSSSDPVPTLQTRQNRLQHLTTQLLWRLQQSSPYHASSTAGLVVPVLPIAGAQVALPVRPERLMPGLEESRGALYEIGVTDDGSFVGLTEDELSESLTNLRAMATSLGCKVEILRTVIVGSCEWHEADEACLEDVHTIHKDSLWVAEVLILPETAIPSTELISKAPLSRNGLATGISRSAESANLGDGSNTEQLRISLTGSTTSGKSSLLGTLLTSTLDNGRGKSRLSLLKHRHEIASGVTSSVAPELIGYSAVVEEETASSLSSVINYACGNVSTWNDIHNEAEGGRLVLLTDSAGHPRYRRTTVRGLVSWAPHWTLCCIAADEGSRSNAIYANLDGHAEQDPSVSLSRAHLELCLKLDLPLVVVITKQDLATRTVLRQTLSNVLSAVKAVGRKPVMIMKPSPVPAMGDLLSMSSSDELEVQTAFQDENIVPILLTSAVTGSGISKLHALLRHLPIPKPDNQRTGQEGGVNPLFHIDEVFIKPHDASGVDNGNASQDILAVLSGHLKYGTVSVGDVLHVGPFTPEPSEDLKSLKMQRTSSFPGRGSSGNQAARLSHSMPRDQHFDHHHHTPPPPFAPALYSPSAPFHGEFLPVNVLSIRNLRLPKHRLFPDQVGTIGIELCHRADASSSAALKIRKGMILALRADAGVVPSPPPPPLPLSPSLSPSPSPSPPLTACAAFKARFDVADYHVMEPGALFNVYVASVRAAAKIVTVEIAPLRAHVQDSALFSSQELRERDRALPLSVVGAVGTGKYYNGNGAAAGSGGATQDIFGLDDFHAPTTGQVGVSGGAGGENMEHGEDDSDEEDEDNGSGGVALHQHQHQRPHSDEEEEEEGKGDVEIEIEEEVEDEDEGKEMIDVVFQLLNYREWIEVGAQVLVMPGSALEGSVGLDGFVGRVTGVL